MILHSLGDEHKNLNQAVKQIKVPCRVSNFGMIVEVSASMRVTWGDVGAELVCTIIFELWTGLPQGNMTGPPWIRVLFLPAATRNSNEKSTSNAKY